MSKGNNRKSTTIPVHDPATKPGAPLARKSKDGKSITVSYKGHSAKLPSILNLPYEIVDEYFDFEELPEAQQKTASTKLFRKLAKYFVSSNEDFATLTSTLTFPETLAVTITWLNANGGGQTLGK